MDEEQEQPSHGEPARFSIPDEAFEDAVVADRTARRTKRGKAHHSSAWITGPGSVLLLVEAARDLVEIAAARGEPQNRVEYVKLAFLPSIRSLVIWPAHERDPERDEVTWRDGTASLVASDVLIRAHHQVESGKAVRFPVYQVPESKYGPVLAIEMRVELQVKNLAKRRRKRRQQDQEGQ